MEEQIKTKDIKKHNLYCRVFIHNEKCKSYTYYKDKERTILHREDGPAIDAYIGRKEWWLNGKQHREDGPAVITGYGSEFWYYNNVLHRINGPACIWSDGYEEFYINGVFYTEENYWAIMKLGNFA